MTTETLIVDGQNTQEAAAQTTEATSTTMDSAAEPTTQTTDATQAASADTTQAEDTTQTQTQAQPEGAPEKYEFKPLDGVALDDAVIGAFSDAARELNLPQDAAQKVIDKVAPVIAARQREQFEAINRGWVEQIKSDKDFGGDKLDANLAVARKALDQFGSPALRTLLNESGMGNNPEVIRAFYRIGKAISEDTVTTGAATHTAGDIRSLYPNSNMK